MPDAAVPSGPDFPFRLTAPAEHAGALPARVDVAVIGGGVAGVSAALELGRAGLSVLVLEKGRIAAEQSSRNWGWIRVQGRDPGEVPLALEARALWQALDRQCRGRLGVRRMGVSYLARRPADMARHEAWLAAVADHGLDSRLLGRRGLADLAPGHAADWIGALHTPSDLCGEPWQAVPELARLARSEGVTLREGCAVRGLDIAAGRVAGVVTEAGRVAADAVVLAGGAWSGLFLGRHGVALPQLSVRATALATQPLPETARTGGLDGRVAFRRRADGGYTLAPSTASEFRLGPAALRWAPRYRRALASVGYRVRLGLRAPAGFPDAWGTPRRWDDDRETPFERMRILDPEPDRRGAAAACAAFAAAFPGLGPVRPRRVWAGMIDVLPDVVPVIDRVAALPGLTLLTGFSGHGFGIGPAAGRAAAALVEGRAPGHDLARFRFARFSDGSIMRPGPGF
ncbi:NAD(P)/FAD-dependent oxidoreductase [Roseivivax sp. CAU 1761]